MRFGASRSGKQDGCSYAKERIRCAEDNQPEERHTLNAYAPVKLDIRLGQEKNSVSDFVN